MKLSLLLDKLREHSDEIQIEERISPDGRALIFYSKLPFPFVPEPVWYVIVIEASQEDVDDREIRAMLRHLKQYQIDLPLDGDDPDDPDDGDD